MSSTILPSLFIFAGANGSGKSTLAKAILPYGGVVEFLNADGIAYGLSPFSPEGQRVKAGKLFIGRMRELIAERKKFAIETTLSGRTLSAHLKEARKNGFHIRMFYVHTTDVNVNIERIKTRVLQGEHDVPTKDVRRRYDKSLKNLFHVYFDLCDTISVYDNSADTAQLIAFKGDNATPCEGGTVLVAKEYATLWQTIKKQAGSKDDDEKYY